MDLNSSSPNKLNKVINYTLALLTFFALILFVIFRQTQEFSLEPFKDIYKDIGSAFFNTIFVSIISLFGSMIIGFIFYLMSKSKIKYFNALVDVFTEIIYGTPLLVMIIVMAYVIGPAFMSGSRQLSDLQALGIVGIVIYMSPYMSNVFKAAFSSVSEEQYMAMDLFGFTSFQKYRYIIVPQVMRVLMPPLMNNFSLIIKGSALLHVLSYNEIYHLIYSETLRNFAFIEGFILLWLMYLVITIPLSQLAKYVGRRLEL
jgi:polar amino acid transport system permease protein